MRDDDSPPTDGPGDPAASLADLAADAEIVLIAAVAENGVIGSEGGMPWHYPDDLRHFKETTMGHPVIVGRKTFERIVDRLGEPLPGRTNVVLSRSTPDLPDGVLLANSPAEALAVAIERDDRVFVIGGGAVYEAFLPIADRLVLTEIHACYEGDTEFPAWPPGDEWRERDRDDYEELSFVIYERETVR